MIRAHLIHAYAAIETGRGSLGTLVYILLAGLTSKSAWAFADVGGF